MSAVDHGPLAALLSQHPEECADALAFLVERGHTRGVWRGAAEEQGLTAAIDALCAAHVAISGESFYWLAEDIDPRSIARQGALSWLRARLGIGPVEARYAARDAIAVRVAAVLDCRPGDVEFEWRSSRLDSIYVGGEGLDASETDALIKAGFEPSSLGWDVPGDCGEEQAK